jgi:hypothetical protein
MITPIEYSYQLQQINNLDDFNKPDFVAKEPVFDVDLNTREIKIPSQFRNLAVYSDHNAETIWFVTNRYFDGEDLFQKRIAMQYVNAKGEEGLDILDTYDYYTASSHERIGENELLIAWKLDYAVTKASGPIQFSLRFFDIDDKSQNTLTYNLTTRPATVTILSGLHITENSVNPVLPKTKLEELVDQIYNAYKQGQVSFIEYSNIIFDTLPKIDGKVVVTGDIQSENFDIAHYPNLLDRPTINGSILTGDMKSRNLVISTNDNNEITDISVGIDMDTDFNEMSLNPVQNRTITKAFNETNGNVSTLTDKVTKLEDLFEELTFIPIAITSLTIDPNIKETGDSVENPVLTWLYNQEKSPKELLLNGQSIEDVTVKEIAAEGTFTETTVFTLKATDTFNNSSEKDVTLHFVDAIYYNVAEEPSEYNSDFITSLANKALSAEKAMTLNFEAGENQFIYICTPEDNGDYIFMPEGSLLAGGFGAGPAATVDFTNDFGVIKKYRIYKSDNTNLGKTNVSIS